MAKKVEINIYEVVKPFALDGSQYNEGDEWLRPQDWREVTDQETLNTHDFPVFEFDQLMPNAFDENKKPIYQTYRRILPVKQKDA